VVHGIFFLGSFLPHDRVLGFGTGAQAALDTRAAAYFTVVDRPQGGVEPAQVAAETVGGLLQATRDDNPAAAQALPGWFPFPPPPSLPPLPFRVVVRVIVAVVVAVAVVGLDSIVRCRMDDDGGVMKSA